MKGFLQNIMGKKLVRIILALFLFCFVVTSIYPLIWLVFFSFKSNEEIFGGNVIGPPKEWLIENYKDALLGGKVLGYLGNSIFVTFVVIVASTVLISMVAYAVTRMKWKLRGVTYWFFMAGLTIPVHATLLPLFIILKRLNILNTPLAIIIPYTAFALPFGIMVLGNHYASVPYEMEEAACIMAVTFIRLSSE